MAGKGRKPFWDQRREKFAQLLAQGFSAEDAGSVVRYAAANARRNAQRQDVKARVAELKAPALEKLKEQIVINQEWARDKFLQVIETAELSDIGANEFLKATIELCKLYRLYPAERHEHSGADGGPIRTEDLTDIELSKRLAHFIATAKLPDDDKPGAADAASDPSA